MDRVDCVVIGAGVVGLAIARAQARAGREVLILEGEPIIGSGTSSRNSEVIHAGIYYPQGSLKARFCVAGKQALYALCESHGIPHRRCGKLIVATAPEQVDGLLDIRRHAEANGVDDLRLLDAGELADLEPNLHAVAALLSPSTGIIDSHAYMLALQGDAEAAGAALAVQAPVIGGAIRDDGILLRIGGAEPMELLAERVINSAGLSAQRVAASLEGFAAEHVPPTYYAKGNYFNLTAKSPFSRLVYPMPEPGGLGTHLTLDLGGQARFGPDVQWVEAPDYHVDPSRGDAFYAAIRRYWPALPDEALVPAYCGIRPKISGPGEAAADFRIDGPQVHGVAGLVNLFGIESPGLTSALAIGDYVAELLRRA